MYRNYDSYMDPYTTYEATNGLKRSRGSDYEPKSSRRRSASEAESSYCYLEQFNDSVSDSSLLSPSLFSQIASSWKRRNETQNLIVPMTQTQIPKLSYVHFNGASIICSTQDTIDYFVNQLLYRDSHLTEIDYESFETKEFILESLANAKLSEKALVEEGSLSPADNYYQGHASHQSLVIMDLRISKTQRDRSHEESVKECISKTGTWKYMSLGIGNLLSLRKNFEELKKESQQLGQGNSSKLAEITKNSGWLKQLCEILQCVELALRVLHPKEENGVRQPSTILLHCSENIKRVRQISLLVKVCSNSYYRTRKGYVELLEKEFCLRKSNHHTLFQEGYSDSSPIILQTLDCTRIFIEQFPTMFEFTSDFLVAFYSLIRRTKPLSPRLSPRTREMSKSVMEDVAFKSLVFEQDVQEIPAFLYRLHVEVRLWGAYFQLRNKIWAFNNDDVARLRSSWDQRVESPSESEEDLISSR